MFHTFKPQTDCHKSLKAAYIKLLLQLHSAFASANMNALKYVFRRLGTFLGNNVRFYFLDDLCRDGLKSKQQACTRLNANPTIYDLTEEIQ